MAWLRLRDRFGDAGLVCVGIIRRAENDDLGNRHLFDELPRDGPAVEDAFLSYLAELAMVAGR